MEEEEERNQAPKWERVLKQVWNQDLARPSKEEVEDKFNETCQGCEITFDGRKSYLQHCRAAHGWTIKMKGGMVFPPLSLPDQPGPPTPTPKKSSQRRGQSLPPAQGPGAQDRSRGAHVGGMGPVAYDQLGGRPTPRGVNSGASRGSPVKAFKPPEPEARGAGSAS